MRQGPDLFLAEGDQVVVFVALALVAAVGFKLDEIAVTVNFVEIDAANELDTRNVLQRRVDVEDGNGTAKGITVAILAALQGIDEAVETREERAFDQVAVG